MSALFRLGAYFLLRRPTKHIPFAELIETCQQKGIELEQAYVDKLDNEKNKRIMSHIIGIEKWGQRRLQVALGEPLLANEYLDYRPARAVPFPELCEQFPAVRAATITLANQIAQTDAVHHKVPHNQFGDLDGKAWLHYLTIHADRESQALE